MSKCQHCNKLTHSEDVNVYFHMKDFEKIQELYALENWVSPWNYSREENNPTEIGKMRCGDIYLHFIAIDSKTLQNENDSKSCQQ